MHEKYQPLRKRGKSGQTDELFLSSGPLGEIVTAANLCVNDLQEVITVPVIRVP